MTEAFFLQEHVKKLYERGVAYLNMDMVVQGTFAIRGGCGPLLEEAMFTVARGVSDILLELRSVVLAIQQRIIEALCYLLSDISKNYFFVLD